MNIVESLYNAVMLNGHRECIRYKSDGQYCSKTYQEFWQAIMDFSLGLKFYGIHEGDKVGIISTNCPEWAISDYAVLALGGVVVPIYPTLPAAQIDFILQNAEVKCVIVQDAEQFWKVQQVWSEKLRIAIVIQGGDIPNSEKNTVSFSDVLRAGQQGQEKWESEFLNIPDHQLATIVHTSGTSGQPKGVMLSHKNIMSNVLACRMIFPIEQNDVSLSFLPLSHILERTVGQFTMFSAGAMVVYSEGIDAIQTNLLEVCPTVLITVPRLLEKVYTKVQAQIEQAPAPIRSLIKTVLKKQKSSGLTFRLVDRIVFQKLRAGLGGKIRVVVSGGASLAPNIAWFYTLAGIPVYEGYGMTETAPVVAANPYGANRPGTVGRQLPGVEIRLAEDGELLVKGPNVMMGYYRAPEETAKVFDNGWLLTGDIAELEDGYIKIVDRKKNILVLATGKNVAPAPIENAIVLSAYVAGVVVIGDRRKYITCLLSPDFESLQPIASELGLGEEHRNWVAHPHIRALFATEVARLTVQFAEFERPKRAVLLPQELSLETGELTPTLKVRSKVIMSKFVNEIEDMYRGINYIPTLSFENLDDHRETSISSVIESTSSGHVRSSNESANSILEEEITPKHSPHVGKKGYLLIVTTLVAASVLALVVAEVPLPGNLNILGTIHHIQNTNYQINMVNGKIIGSMTKISDLANATGKINSHLGALSQGVSTDEGSLSHLKNLSEQEINLSNQFYRLAQTLTASLAQVRSASFAQQQSIERMNQISNHLAATTVQLTRTNQSMAGKLTSADEQTRTIAQEMP